MASPRVCALYGLGRSGNRTCLTDALVELGTHCGAKRGAPSRFACGVGAVWLIVTGWAFQSGAIVTGYVLGGMLTFVGLLVSTTDICIPSLIYRTMFGFPSKSGNDKA